MPCMHQREKDPYTHRIPYQDCLCAIQYVGDTQKSALPHLQSITVERREDAVVMDGPTRRNLELETSLSGHDQHTLAGVMDRCQSPMGSRLLRRWIQRPRRDADLLRSRYPVSEPSAGGNACRYSTS